jgi:CubicO group peptidase (beta-lactamase class C family)
MDPEPRQVIKSKNWPKTFLAAPIAYKPGTVFLYNSWALHVVRDHSKVTGQKVVEYLRPRLFEPLGISGMDWEENITGINTGAWGFG